MQSLRLGIALGPLRSLPLPCSRYGCGGCVGVTHNRRVSDTLHRHSIFDTMTMSTHLLLPLTSYLYATKTARRGWTRCFVVELYML